MVQTFSTSVLVQLHKERCVAAFVAADGAGVGGVGVGGHDDDDDDDEDDDDDDGLLNPTSCLCFCVFQVQET